MSQSRREFLSQIGATSTGFLIASTLEPVSAVAEDAVAASPSPAHPAEDPAAGSAAEIDFRYSPATWQTAFCFPDDPHKSLVGERGDLRYGYSRDKWIVFFPVTLEFTTGGMGTDKLVSQEMEGPAIPIVHTHLKRGRLDIEIITFASRTPEEGRVDNVLVIYRPAPGTGPINVFPTLHVRSVREPRRAPDPKLGVIRWDSETGPLFVVSSATLRGSMDERPHGIVRTDATTMFEFGRALATEQEPVRVFFRLPQEDQKLEQLTGRLGSPDVVLEEARAFWRQWLPYGKAVTWSIPARSGDFLTSCARNIQQAREVRHGRLTFQVGPTLYRGLWVVDGHFILEAARYLGYDEEAQKGLETTWASQREDGGVFAGGGGEHWKDTAIAMFTLVRHAELSQDWSYFRRMTPQLLRATQFLVGLREKARKDNTINGRYGLLAPGFADGGLWGVRNEFTNTLWTLAGLKAVRDAAAAQGLASEFTPVKAFHDELHAAFVQAAAQQMREHAEGFTYLPMLVKEDEQWNHPDEWERPRPQQAQWALSQAIYPGLILDPEDPIVKGHIRLMQWCTQEDIPAETGWLHHEGLWNYNAGFVAQVYLWAGLPEWARRTFIGLLNHAAPTHCWREEQPLQTSAIGTYVGDMPHNWASAECVRYLRHMLALEDGTALHLLTGVTSADLASPAPWTLAGSPTRFGRISLNLEPAARHRWQLRFSRNSGPHPRTVTIPDRLGNLRLRDVKGATQARVAGSARVQIAPDSPTWEATWG